MKVEVYFHATYQAILVQFKVTFGPITHIGCIFGRISRNRRLNIEVVVLKFTHFELSC